jgi:hypothetical protein
VPVPSVTDLVELNTKLLAGCRSDEARAIAGRRETVGDAWRSSVSTSCPRPAS